MDHAASTVVLTGRLAAVLGNDAPDLTLTGTYTVVVVDVPEHRRREATGLLAELDGRPADGREVLAGPYGGDGVILAPTGSSGSADRFVEGIGLNGRFYAATAYCGCDALATGFSEAKNLLALALAAERGPGLYDIDDFLVEYAALRDPVVSARLVAMVRSLLHSEGLYETLKAFVRCGHNRGRTARELFVHRTTLDYRIRRITEITGHDPTSGHGGKVLTAAVTLFSALENTRR